MGFRPPVAYSHMKNMELGKEGCFSFFQENMDMAGLAWPPDGHPDVTGRELLPMVEFLHGCAPGPCH